MGDANKFDKREIIFPKYPSLDILDKAVQEIKDTYEDALDAILFGGNYFRSLIQREDGQTDLWGGHLFPLFNYDWMVGKDTIAANITGLLNEMEDISKKYKGDKFEFLIHPVHTGDYIKNAAEITWACVPNMVLYASPNLIQRLELDND